MYSGRLEERLCATGLAERGVFVCVSVCLRHTLSLCGRGQYEDRDDDEVPPQPAPPPPANNAATFPALGGGGNAPAAPEPVKPQSAQPPQQSAPVDPAVLQMGPYASTNSTAPAQVPCKCIKQGSASLREGEIGSERESERIEEREREGKRGTERARGREGERARGREREGEEAPRSWLRNRESKRKNAYPFLSLSRARLWKKPCQNGRRECELLFIVCATPQLGLVPCLNL
jgi:hypothetical protein